MTTSSAIRLARRLESLRPAVDRRASPGENRDEMARVARSTSIPVATGERLEFEFRELGETGRIDPARRLGVSGNLGGQKDRYMAEAYYAQIACTVVWPD